MQSQNVMAGFVNSSLSQFKQLTNLLLPLSKQSAQTNNNITNKLLLTDQKQALSTLRDLLSHLLHISHLKGTYPIILSLLIKIIGFIKIFLQKNQIQGKIVKPQAIQQIKNKQQKSNEQTNMNNPVEIQQILFYTLDILCLLKNKQPNSQLSLRIIQVTFSLIDPLLISHADVQILTRLYALCFQCGQYPTIKSIASSALLALTEIIFSRKNTKDGNQILIQFLQYLVKDKKFSWIRQGIKQIIWDLIVVAIKSIPVKKLKEVGQQSRLVQLIKQIYIKSIRKVFSLEQKKDMKNQMTKRLYILDFALYLRAFISISVQFALHQEQELVPFRENLHLFRIAYELQRDSRLYMMLEGVSILLVQGNLLLLQDERAVILLQVFTKVVQELCLQKTPIQMNTCAKDLLVQKTFGDIPKINDSDYPKLLKQTIIKLRKKFQNKLQKKASELWKQQKQQSPRSQRHCWQRLVNAVVKCIRYLTSLNLKQLIDEQTVRKLIIELQYWFLISPTIKIRNIILGQLLKTSTLMDTKLQAIRVSQCVQIGSNIIYGYYSSLDVIGLTLLLRMIAGVKTSWEDGKGFDQLQQVCGMSQRLYQQQRLVKSSESYRATLQAFIQQLSSIAADLKQIKQQKSKNITKSITHKPLRIAQYLFSKLQLIIGQYPDYLKSQWNLLTGFWVSLCGSKNSQFRQKVLDNLINTVLLILDNKILSQESAISPYAELASLSNSQISQTIIQHLKNIVLKVRSETGVVEVMRIISVLLNKSKQVEKLIELQQIVVKQTICYLQSSQSLSTMIDTINNKGSDKNQQYKTVNLVWNVSDHLKLLHGQGVKQLEGVWRKIFKKIAYLGTISAYGQTKQVCIHTLTQIIGENYSILGKEQTYSLVRQHYFELFLVMLGLSQSSPRLQGASQAQTVKIGVKNYLKLIKKCGEDMKEKYDQLQRELLQTISQRLSLLQQQFTLDYYYQLIILVQNQRLIGNCTTECKKLLETMEGGHAKFQKTTTNWRKKYEPAFLKLKQYFINIQ